jgi:hypothetical protein
MCLLSAVILANIDHRPVCGLKLLKAIALSQRAKEELNGWKNIDSWRSERMPYEIQKPFFQTLQNIAECMYHATRLLKLEEKFGNHGLLTYSGTFQRLIEKTRNLVQDGETHEALLPCAKNLAYVIEKKGVRKMTEVCDESMKWTEALYWQQKVIDNINANSAFFSFSSSDELHEASEKLALFERCATTRVATPPVGAPPLMLLKPTFPY